MKWNKKCRYFDEKYACDTLTTENLESCEECKFANEYSKKILIIKLGALGDVLRTTCILPALRLKYGEDIMIYWMTDLSGVELLKNNQFIDRILPYNNESIMRVGQEKFDILFSLEIDTPATLIANLVNAEKKFGYYFDDGTTSCFNKSSEEYLSTAFLNHIKINNKKTYQELISKACELQDYYNKDRPIFNLSDKDKKYGRLFKLRNDIRDEDKIIGINIGSSGRWESKFWKNDKIKELIRGLEGHKIILLGGSMEAEKQSKLIEDMEMEGIKLMSNDPKNSIGEFASIVNMCEVIICGDTLVLHICSSLGKNVVALFFVTSPHEVEGYDEMVKLVSPVLEKYFYVGFGNEELSNSIGVDEVLRKVEELNKEDI